MSLYGALFSGVSGLQSQSSAMGAISDNVANVNTSGYKGTEVNFQTLVTAQVSVTQYSPGGVQSAPRMNVDVQGLLEATTSSTDFGLSGQGFFVVSDQAENPSGFAYSRAGSFKVDKNGFLQNVSGYYLQGWPLTTWDGNATASRVSVDGLDYMKAYKNPTSGATFYINDNVVSDIHMRPLNLSTIGGTARATSSLALGANLPSGAAIGTTEQTNSLIFDSLGNSHNLLYTWAKRDQNDWDVEVMPPRGSTYITIDNQQDPAQTYYSAGRMDFNGIPANGTDFTMDIGGTTYTFQFADTAADTPFTGASLPLNYTNNADADGDSIMIDGVEFTLVNGAATGSQQVDISGAASAADVAAAVASAADAYFVNRDGGAAGSYVTNAGGTLQTSSFAIGNPTNGGATDTFGGAITVTSTTTTIATSGRSLSQVLDQLGDQVNAALSYEYGFIKESTPETWGGRVSGENAIMFRNGDTANPISVASTNDLVDNNGISAVIQNIDFTVPALSSHNWANVGDHAVTFNGDGSINEMFGLDETSANDPRSQIRIGWANGALNMDGSDVDSGGSPAISQFIGNYNETDGMQQLGDAYQLNYVRQDGNRFGNFAGISVAENGVVTALFDNGVQTPIFMIPVATFVNPNGMDPLTGNVFQQTDTSGLPVVREGGTAGAAAIAQATREASTVDLGEEFTNMITTQRAYSAASKIITTSDEMLEELIRIKR